MFTANDLLIAQEKIKFVQNLARALNMDDRDPLVLQYVENQIMNAAALVDEIANNNTQQGNSADDRINLTDDND